jgi:hypothetical protein
MFVNVTIVKGKRQDDTDHRLQTGKRYSHRSM